MEVNAFHPGGQWVSTPVQAAGAVALIVCGCVGGYLLRSKMRRVALAGGPVDRRGRYGPLVLCAALVLGATAGWAVEAAALATEPTVSVEARVRCGGQQPPDCDGRWEHAGQEYFGDGRPFDHGRSGETLRIEVFAARPDVVASGWDSWDTRYGVRVAAAVFAVLAVRWLRRSIALTRTLHGLARNGTRGPGRQRHR